jgi:hypothetical protein
MREKITVRRRARVPIEEDWARIAYSMPRRTAAILTGEESIMPLELLQPVLVVAFAGIWILSGLVLLRKKTEIERQNSNAAR